MNEFGYYQSLKFLDFFRQSLLTQMHGIDGLVHIVHYALSCQTVPGDIVEFGCFQGHVSKILSCITPDKKVYVYDSFEGLPAPLSEENHIAGIMNTSVESLHENFQNDQIPLPIITQGWFCDVVPDQVPGQISFAFLDGDLYDSIKYPLELVYSKLSPGAVLMIDDYHNPGFPGARKATDEFFSDKPEHVIELPRLVAKSSGKAVIVKL